MRYHTKYRDTIRYDTIGECFTLCKNRKQAGNSAQQWSTVVRSINTVATAGAWILAIRRGYGRRAAGVPRSPGLFNRATVSTGRQTIAAVEAIVWRPHGTAGGHVAQIFSDCAITKYLSRATAFTVNTSTHPGGRAITAN